MPTDQIHGQNRGILVCDYGSQYTLLIARRLRELGYYAEIIDGVADEAPAHFAYQGIILSGGPDSLSQTAGRQAPDWIWAAGCPVLGICYGMQLMVGKFCGTVHPSTTREYGRSQIKWANNCTNPSAKTLLNHAPKSSMVWMSHGDSVTDLGDSLELLASTEDQAVAAVVHKTRPYVGLQFHPEVQHSEWGAELLSHFAGELCGLPKDWKAKDMLSASLEHVNASLQPKDRILAAVSGGVDSTVASALIARAVGHDRLTCVLVDHGLLRENEVEQVCELFQQLTIKLIVLDESQYFFKKLEGVSDPESKRKIIGNSFIDAFESYARAHAHTYTHLAQGTLYPDVIESAGHGSGAKIIKSHHNVGGLPEKLQLKLIEPFRFLFKDEVRQIGRELAIPEQILMRHPFPGPGLGIRIPGVITREKVTILQKADTVFIKALRETGFYDSTWQAATILLPVKSVGVMGDNRSYQYTCVLRAVSSTDGMTADVSDLPISFLTQVSDAIVRAVDGINRVLYDITSKPPATIEWE